MSLRVNKSTAKLAFKGIGRQVEKMKLGFGMVEQTKDENLALLANRYFQVHIFILLHFTLLLEFVFLSIYYIPIYATKLTGLKNESNNSNNS